MPINYCFNVINTTLQKYIKYLSRDKYRDIYRDKLGQLVTTFIIKSKKHIIMDVDKIF